MRKRIEDLIRHVENSVTTVRMEAETVPSNTFMRWLRRISDENINIIFEYIDSKKFFERSEKKAVSTTRRKQVSAAP